MSPLPFTVVSVLLVAACASSRAPTDRAGPGACREAADCVLYRGDPCNPCGSCPVDTPFVVSAKRLEQMRSESSCADRLGVDRGSLACSPCPNGGVMPTAHAECVANACALR